MAIIYRGWNGSSFVYWDETVATPGGVTSVTVVRGPQLTTSGSDTPDVKSFLNGSLSVSGTVEVTGTLRSTQGISGSLTRLADGTSYLIAGTNITILSASNGSVTITAAGTGGGGGTGAIYWQSTSPDSIFTTGSVKIGDYGTNKSLNVNGMNLTPYSGSQTIPGSTSTNVILLDLSGTFSNNQYATFNVDVVASTSGITNISQVAVGKWKLSVSMIKCGGNFEMVGVTEFDAQHFTGGSAVDNPALWYVDVNSSGSLYVNTAGTMNSTAWGAVVTKQTVIDVNAGSLIA